MAGIMNDEGLTPTQEKALSALLIEPSVTAAAQKAGVGERTLHRWIRTEPFRGEYRRARAEAFSQAIGLAQRAASAAVGTLLRVMHDSTAPAAARVAAASQMLRFARESIELDDLAQRVEALEASGMLKGEAA